MSAVIRTLLQLVQVAVLARLLSPGDYGLMALVTTILGFAGLFADMGLSSAFIQRQQVTDEQRSSLFWLSLALAGAVIATLLLASPVIAWIFKDSRLIPLIALSSAVIACGALGVQVRVAAEKALQFRSVVIIELMASLLGLVVAIMGALAKWGVYALVASVLVTAATTTALNWVFNANGWRPLWRCKSGEARPFLAFGGTLMLNHVVNYANAAADILIGGRVLAAAQLGGYSVPRDLCMRIQGSINPIITRVGFPLIASVQHDPVVVRAIYLKTANMSASLNAPIYAGLCFFPQEVVDVWLGAQWAPVAGQLRILALWGAIRSTANPVGSLLFGMGRADLSLRWSIGVFIFQPVILLGGLQWGSEGLAVALLVIQLLLVFPAWMLLVRPVCAIAWTHYIGVVLKPFVIAACGFGLAYGASLQIASPPARLGMAAVVGLGSYLAISAFANREVLASVASVLLRRGTTAG